MIVRRGCERCPILIGLPNLRPLAFRTARAVLVRSNTHNGENVP